MFVPTATLPIKDVAKSPLLAERFREQPKGKTPVAGGKNRPWTVS